MNLTYRLFKHTKLKENALVIRNDADTTNVLSLENYQLIFCNYELFFTPIWAESQ